MKKILILLINIFIYINGYSQYPNTQPISAPYSLYNPKGGLKIDSSLILSSFSDTTRANRGAYIKFYPYTIIGISDSLWMRNSTATKWLKISGSGGGGSGTLTNLTATNTNGFAWTITNPTTTPNLVLSTSLTQGSVPFIGNSGGLTQNNSEFHFDGTFLGIGNALPQERLDVTGAINFSSALMPNHNAGTINYSLVSRGPGTYPIWSSIGTGCQPTITVLSDSTHIKICSCSGICDTVAACAAITATTTIQFTSDTTLSICTTDDSSRTTCTTCTIPRQTLLNVPINTLRPATGTNVINNGNYIQEWQWNSLVGGGLKLSSQSTAATGNTQQLLQIFTSGTNANINQTTYGLTVNNIHNGGGAWNVGGYFQASGAPNNSAIIVPLNRGNIGFGTSTPDIGAVLHIVTNAGLSGIINESVLTGNNGAALNIFRFARGSVTAKTIISSGDKIGTLDFKGYDGSNYITAAKIRADADGTTGTNDMPGRLSFFTTADGAASETERFRINNLGNLFAYTMPTTSAGSYDILTRNSSTSEIEKIASSSFEVPLTFNNGLTRTVNTIKLGGALLATTNITGTFDLNLGTSGSKLANLYVNSAGVFSVLSSGISTIEHASASTEDLFEAGSAYAQMTSTSLLTGSNTLVAIDTTAINIAAITSKYTVALGLRGATGGAGFQVTSAFTGLSSNFDIDTSKIKLTPKDSLVILNLTSASTAKVLHYNTVTGKVTYADTTASHSALTLSAIGSSPNANGATLTGQVLNFEPASASFGGVVNTIAQVFAGQKTLANPLLTTLSNVATSKVLRWNSSTGAVTWADTTVAISGSPSALTKTDDTNVTLTLGGTPTTALLQATSLTLGWTGILSVARGGTSYATYTTGDVLYASGSGTLTKLGIGTTRQKLGVVGGIPAWVDSSAVGSTVTPAALTRTDDTNVTLTLGGTPTTALLQATSLTLGWTGTLAATRGGTGFGSYAVGDMLYASTTTAFSKRVIGTTGQKLTVVGGLPVWVDSTAVPSVTPAALTKVDDANVTLSLGGTPSTALLQAASLTLGWTGTLAVARGGTNISSYTTGDIIYASASGVLSKLAIGTTRQKLSVVGGLPAWVDTTAAGSSTIPINNLLAATGANTINNANYAQEWDWNTLNGTLPGLYLKSASTTAADNNQTIFKVSLSGVNATSAQTSYAAFFENVHTGTTSTNVGASFSASGGTTANYAIIVPSGLVGLGNSAPTQQLDVTGAIRFSSALMPNNLPGTSGQVLTSAGSGAVPTWQTPTTGTVTSVSVVTANGFAGTVATATTTPAITLTTSVTSGQVLYSSSSALTGSANLTYNAALLTGLSTSLGVTQDNTKGLLLVNTTAAAAGAQQMSPIFRQAGNGWKTDATAASQEVAFRTFVIPVQGASAPTGYWRIESGINTTYKMVFGIGDQGEIYASGSVGTANQILYSNGAGNAAFWGAANFEVPLTFSTGLTRATNTITANISTGIAGSQIAYGGTAANEDLTLRGTTHATKTTSYILLQDNGGNVGVGNTAPIEALDVTGGAIFGTYPTGWTSQGSGTLTVGAPGSSSTIYIGQSTTGLGAIQWNYDATIGNAFLSINAGTTTRGVLLQSNNGPVGIGNITPTARLHLPAGSTSASTAPLKFTSGTNLTTTEAGAMEFNGTHLYFTIANGGTRYQIDQQSGATGATVALDNLSGVAINATLIPGSSGAIDLGSTTKMWGSLFLKSGGVINFNNGNMTITHSAAVLTIGGGDLKITSPGNVSTSALTTDATQTLTNKRITLRYGSTTSSATPTINTDNVDTYELTALAANITSFTTNLSGTPTTDQTLHIIIVGTATRTLVWGTSFEASTVDLPTTTSGTNRLDVFFIWNATTSKWRCSGTF